MTNVLLQPGSIIGVCAPSARFDTEKLKKGVRVLREMGFEIRIPDEIFRKKRYLAGDDRHRAGIVETLFSDPAVKAVICARGGFGSMRVLEYLNWDVIRNNPKPFIGFSDSTALLLSIINETGNLVIHGPTVVSFADAAKETIDSFYKTLVGTVDEIQLENGQVLFPGTCRGILKGGNISTISHLLGTRFQPVFKQSVLFLEDISEPAYKIDRMLTQMKMAGLFDGIAGVITGSFEDCDYPQYIAEILSEIFKDCKIPVLSGLASGHGKVNFSLTMGREVQMETTPGKISWK